MPASSCGDGTAVFDDIALGTGTVTFTEGSSLSQLTWHSTTAAGTPSAATTPSGASGSSTTVTANFFDVGATITEAALHNNPTSASADTIAIQDFGDIVLGASDDLTVQWTVTVDGS